MTQQRFKHHGAGLCAREKGVCSYSLSSGRGNAEGTAIRLSQGAALQAAKAAREHPPEEVPCTSARRWKESLPTCSGEAASGRPLRQRLGQKPERPHLILAPHPKPQKGGFPCLG